MPSIYVNYGVHGVRDCSRPAMAMVYNIYAKYGRPASTAAGFDIGLQYTGGPARSPVGRST